MKLRKFYFVLPPVLNSLVMIITETRIKVYEVLFKYFLVVVLVLYF